MSGFKQIGQFDRSFYPHFVKKIGSMHLDCAHADVQFVGNHLVEFAEQDELHDLSLAGG